TEIGTLAGAAAIRREIEDMMRSYDDFHAANEEVLDLGNGVTFCVRVFTAHPVGSSGEVRIRFGSVASWTEGLIERENTYVDIAEARAAAERLAEARG